MYMSISFFDALKVLKGTEVEAPRIIPPNHTPNHTPESYPRIIPPKITILNVSCRIVWDCIGLTSFNGTGLTS